MTQTARIYGDSLYDLAKEEAMEERLMEQTEAVMALFAENPSYLSLLSEPSLPKGKRLALLDEAFGGQIETYLLNFLKILCENHLLSEYKGCCEQYKTRFYKDRGIAIACVTTAVALNAAQKEALVKNLEKQCGKTVILTEQVKPDVIGGLRIELEGRLIDGTVQGRMAGMKKKLKEIIM